MEFEGCACEILIRKRHLSRKSMLLRVKNRHGPGAESKQSTRPHYSVGNSESVRALFLLTSYPVLHHLELANGLRSAKIAIFYLHQSALQAMWSRFP